MRCGSGFRGKASVETDVEGRVDVAVAVGAECDVGLGGIDARDLGDAVGNDLGNVFVTPYLNDRDQIDGAGHRVDGLHSGQVADCGSRLIDLVDIDGEEADSGDHESRLHADGREFGPLNAQSVRRSCAESALGVQKS